MISYNCKRLKTQEYLQCSLISALKPTILQPIEHDLHASKKEEAWGGNTTIGITTLNPNTENANGNRLS